MEREPGQAAANAALVKHVEDVHKLDGEFALRVRRAYVDMTRSYRRWLAALDNVDQKLGYTKRNTGFRSAGERRMEAILGIKRVK